VLKPFFTLKVERTVLAVAAILVLASIFYIFAVVPNERVMGAVQRIFYYHVGGALACYVFVGVVFCSSVLFLLSDNPKWDMLADAAAGIAFMFCTAVLASGMIWGHSAWNTWWRWEPRLVSFLVLWLILFALCALRLLSERDERQSRFAAVLGIFSAINVPIVILSIRLLSASEQLHPQVIANQGLTDPRMRIGLGLSTVALIFLGTALWGLRVRLLVLADRVLNIESLLLDRRK
jgi:heme exporter protein C